MGQDYRDCCSIIDHYVIDRNDSISRKNYQTVSYHDRINPFDRMSWKFLLIAMLSDNMPSAHVGTESAIGHTLPDDTKIGVLNDS